MTITFPDDMPELLEQEAKTAGVPTVDEYVRMMHERAKHVFGVSGENWLADDETDLDARRRLLALAEEGLASPPVADPRGFLAGLAREAAAGPAAR